MTAQPIASTLHADAVAVLDRWAAPDAAQDALRETYRRHLAAHVDGMWRECAAGHLTASALVVDPVGERVLLTLHRKLRMWLQTGGHCEAGDRTLAGAALREASEESGLPGLRLLADGDGDGDGDGQLDPRPVRLDRHHTPCGWHLDVQYVALAPEGAVARISEESLDLRWFEYDEVPGVTDASVDRLLTRARQLLR